MSTKIKFIREYQSHGQDFIDIVYKSGRVSTRAISSFQDIPFSVAAFVVSAKKRTEQFDKLFNRKETIYEL